MRETIGIILALLSAIIGGAGLVVTGVWAIQYIATNEIPFGVVGIFFLSLSAVIGLGAFFALNEK